MDQQNWRLWCWKGSKKNVFGVFFCKFWLRFGRVLVFWSSECTCKLGVKRMWFEKIQFRGVKEEKKRRILVFFFVGFGWELTELWCVEGLERGWSPFLIVVSGFLVWCLQKFFKVHAGTTPWRQNYA
jgi:hypothetical protein